MIYQNNHTGAWAFLIILGAAGLIILGLLLAGTELFSPQQKAVEVSIEATRSSFSMEVTRNAYQPTLDLIQLTQIAVMRSAQGTALAAQKTETKIAQEENLKSMGISATQTAIALELQARQAAIGATQTQIASEATFRQTQVAQQAQDHQNRENVTSARDILIGMASIIVSCAIAYFLVSFAHTKEAAAKARLADEERKRMEACQEARKIVRETSIKKLLDSLSATPKPGNG